MFGFIEIRVIFNRIHSRKLGTTTPGIPLCKYIHSVRDRYIDTSNSPLSSSVRKTSQNTVAIFWDLDNKPPKSFPPYAAAIRLKKAMSEFGIVRSMVAYANRHSFNYVPPEIKQQRKDRKTLNRLENKGIIKPIEPYYCRVCGRRFYNNDKLVHHFKQIHEREHTKRLSQIESAKGRKRVNLVAKYSNKMYKYENSSRDLLTPKLGYGLADELKRAGFVVSTVSDNPQAADVALRERMIDTMDKGRADCLVLVSDDSDFVDVLKEAKERCLRTVVVGDISDGALKRVADSAFSWREFMMGKATKEAVSVVGKWKDRDVLKRLEWSYDRERDRKLYALDDEFDDGESSGFSTDGENDDSLLCKEDGKVWWDLG